MKISQIIRPYALPQMLTCLSSASMSLMDWCCAHRLDKNCRSIPKVQHNYGPDHPNQAIFSQILELWPRLRIFKRERASQWCYGCHVLWRVTKAALSSDFWVVNLAGLILLLSNV
eukprot:scaffold111603_cov20-Prasinocladus_malaysianus.AAC.1